MSTFVETPLFDLLTDLRAAHKPHDTPAILAAVHNDPLPSRQTDRQHIEAAILACAAEHGGLVTIAWVRPHITRDVWGPMIGAVMSSMRSRMEWTGTYHANEGGSGNAAKPARVWRLVNIPA